MFFQLQKIVVDEKKDSKTYSIILFG